MDKQEKTAILAVSFGTCHEETRKRTIEAIERDLALEFPQMPFYRAWTSPRIINKLKKAGYPVPTLKEALNQMLADGVAKVLVQPTYVINGIESDYMKECVCSFRDKFADIAFGTPLLTSEEDCLAVARAMEEEFSRLPEHTALVLMGHGTEHQANHVYTHFQELCRSLGRQNFFIGTVEAAPTIEDITKTLMQTNYRNVVLAPFMIVAGDHAANDMAGEDPDSWKSILLSQGFSVTPILKGLGEYPAVRSIFLRHAREAFSALNAKATHSVKDSN